MDAVESVDEMEEEDLYGVPPAAVTITFCADTTNSQDLVKIFLAFDCGTS
jgi:hypothetical protein